MNSCIDYRVFYHCSPISLARPEGPFHHFPLQSFRVLTTIIWRTSLSAFGISPVQFRTDPRHFRANLRRETFRCRLHHPLRRCSSLLLLVFGLMMMMVNDLREYKTHTPAKRGRGEEQQENVSSFETTRGKKNRKAADGGGWTNEPSHYRRISIGLLRIILLFRAK